MILGFREIRPKLAGSVFVAPGAAVVGDVTIGSDSSIWFGSVVRGDVNDIRIGSRTNVQDNCSLHVAEGTHPLRIGDDCSIGHRAVVHGCSVGDRVLIGMGAIVLDGAVIGDDCIVGAGAVVTEGTVVAPGSVVLGIPARRSRGVSPGDRDRIRVTALNYVELSRLYVESTP